MYIFLFEFFDDFSKSSKNSKKKVPVANESCCKYEKLSIKNTFYFERSKKDKFDKILESLNWIADPIPVSFVLRLL
jgi:hypothetical protein